jgi:hypothetical protein
VRARARDDSWRSEDNDGEDESEAGRATGERRRERDDDDDDEISARAFRDQRGTEPGLI